MKSKTAELLEKAEENIRADYQHDAEVREAEAVEVVNHAADFLVAARNYLTSPAPPTQ